MDSDLPMGYFYLHKSDCDFLKKDNVRSHCTMLKENCELCTDLSIKLWVLWNYSSDQPCLCRIKKKKKKGLENDREAFQSYQSYRFCSFTISQLLRHFRTQLSIPKGSLPQELVRERSELYSLHSMPQQGTI